MLGKFSKKSHGFKLRFAKCRKFRKTKDVAMLNLIDIRTLTWVHSLFPVWHKYLIVSIFVFMFINLLQVCLLHGLNYRLTFKFCSTTYRLIAIVAPSQSLSHFMNHNFNLFWGPGFQFGRKPHPLWILCMLSYSYFKDGPFSQSVLCFVLSCSKYLSGC